MDSGSEAGIFEKASLRAGEKAEGQSQKRGNLFGTPPEAN